MTACDGNDIPESAVMQRFIRLKKEQAKEAVAHLVCDTKGGDPQQDRRLTTYCPVVKYRLFIYDTDDVMAELKRN